MFPRRYTLVLTVLHYFVIAGVYVYIYSTFSDTDGQYQFQIWKVIRGLP
jgi:hypothetical protein